MIKKFTCVLVLLYSLSAAAQESEEIFGINLGGILSSVNSSLPGLKTKPGTGFSVGLTAEEHFTQDVGFFIQANYERRTFTSDYSYSYIDNGTTISGIASSKNTYNTFYIPFGLRYYIPDQDFYLNAGGYLEIFKPSGTQASNNVPVAMYSDSGNAYGLFGGAGYRLELSEEDESDLLFELRYNKGLKDFIDNLPAKMNTISLSVTYRLGSKVFRGW